ncbi:hypothetical protein HS048_14130 [Planomonospora sp. ID91781]|uniref:hypothetical protein n=1 Tax=Planomonospora sp. ID91781 TaxID=2738135 RepID=UPI0018C39D39|nr:hypothetical protein [Planomonospora sp. ID91781]MBG0821876.1 hypothetical protein [Planomonospora sp. ID91781]
MRSTVIRPVVAAIALSLAATMTIGTSASAASPLPGQDARWRVSGTAKIRFEPAATDDITFAIVARGVFTEAKGTIKVGHYRADGNGGGFEADVDCLVAGGPVATVTAVVSTSTSFPVGERIAVSVYDGGTDGFGGSRDRIGWSWSVPTGKVQPCMAPATFATVERGGFTVVGRGWPKPPAQPTTGK